MSSGEFKLHPIQLRALQVLRLSIEVHDPARAMSDDYELVEYALETGRSDYNPEDSTIHVMMRIRCGKFAIDEELTSSRKEKFENQPVSFLVEVGSIFDVDAEVFPLNQVDRFAEQNAPLIIYPYVREQVYGLSTRVGIKPMLLPLFEVPAFKLVKP